MLKAYLDAVAVAGKTFQSTASGPQGLMAGKKAVILEARGGYHTDQADGTAPPDEPLDRPPARLPGLPGPHRDPRRGLDASILRPPASQVSEIAQKM